MNELENIGNIEEILSQIQTSLTIISAMIGLIVGVILGKITEDV